MTVIIDVSPMLTTLELRAGRGLCAHDLGRQLVPFAPEIQPGGDCDQNSFQITVGGYQGPGTAYACGRQLSGTGVKHLADFEAEVPTFPSPHVQTACAETRPNPEGGLK